MSQVVSIIERPDAPAWAYEFAGGTPHQPVGDGRALGVPTTISAGDFALTQVRVCGTADMTPSEFQRRVRAAYGSIAAELRRAAGMHPVRFWNFVPAIHAPVGEGLDRYMAFNQARFDAYCDWYGGSDAFPRSLPTASAVGHCGSDLSIFCLSAVEPGTPLENPRQRPAYRYSRRFGPRPPCFSRGTLLNRGADGRRLLLAAGTSSVRGEESMHSGDFDGQLGETIENLAALIAAACGRDPAAPPASGESTSSRARWRELRIYCTDEGRFDECLGAVGARFHGLERIEAARAELCRRELLVEIEGTAVLE